VLEKYLKHTVRLGELFLGHMFDLAHTDHLGVLFPGHIVVFLVLALGFPLFLVESLLALLRLALVLIPEHRC
jgi:hypothetical protein